LCKEKGEIMKKTTMLFLAFAVTLIGNTSTSFAESYLMIKGGIYSPSETSDLDNFNSGNRSHLDSKTGFAGEIAAGHYFLPMLALELGAGYFESKGSTAAQAGDLKLKVVPLIATGKVFLPLGIFEPFGLAGVGAYITDLKVDGNSSNFRGSTEVTYGFHAGAGFNINFPGNIIAGAEGKYLWAEPDFGGQHIKIDGFIATGNIGLKF
jgi:outer membrane protein W